MADDPSIPDASRLFRRIPLDSHFIVWDQTVGAYRLSTQAFKNLQENPPAFSVHLECVLQDAGLATQSVLKDPEHYGLVALTAALVRAHQQAVEKHPEPGDPAHGHVVGHKPRGVMKAFVSAVTQGNQINWVVPPPNWPWPPPSA